MKYRYKISYGGTSSTTNKMEINLNYFIEEMTKIILELDNVERNYNQFVEISMEPEDKINTLHKMEQYQKVNDDQLIKLIPKIKDIYLKFYKEYFNNNEEISNTESETYIRNKTKNFNEEKDFINFLENKHSNTYIIKKILPEESKIIYLGDYHSSVHSLIDIIINLQNKNILTNEYKLADNYYIVFLGDFVDRGPLGIECLYIIYLLFLINNSNEKERVFILNGNHEEKNTYSNFDFSKELEYQLKKKETIIEFEKLIRYLPLALFIKIDKENSKWYQFCHGGIDKHQLDFSKFNSFLDSDEKNYLTLSYNLSELIGFLWSDFITLEKYIIVSEQKYNQLLKFNEIISKFKNQDNLFNSFFSQNYRNHLLNIMKNKSINIDNDYIYIFNNAFQELLRAISANDNKHFNESKNIISNIINILKQKVIDNETINLLKLFENLRMLIYDPNNPNNYLESSTRPIYNDKQVNEILSNLNIMTIISGHQDQTNYAFLLKNIEEQDISNKISNKEYILDKIYGYSFGLYSFNLDYRDDNSSSKNSLSKSLEKSSTISDLNSLSKSLEKANINLKKSNTSSDLGNLKKEKEEKEKEEEDNYNYSYSDQDEDELLDVSGNIIEKEINMNDILASVISSATISKDLQYSIYGILNLDTNISQIYYLNQFSGK